MKSMKKDDTANDNVIFEDSASEVRAHLEKLCKCDRILSESEIPNFEDISRLYYGDRKFELRDHCSDDIEAEYAKLIKRLQLPEETYSMTKIETNLPQCVKFGVRSGMTHMNMQKFSSLSRGYQAPATAVVAIATSFVIKPHCWNEAVIDQVIDDGDTYYSDSYKRLKMDDRRAVTLLHLQSHFNVRNTHRAVVQIDDPLYAGTFRSERPQDLHVAKALDLFFKKHDICVLASPVLNVAIWKCCRHFNVFDAQPRLENCEIDDSDDGGGEGTAKLIFVEDLAGVLFIILEKSRVQNESFVLYKVSIASVKELASLPQEPEKPPEEPKLPPTTYQIPDVFRAVVQGSYHTHHPNIPEEFHGRSNLVGALAAIVYSKLLSTSKWTRIMIDLIVNQANIYLADLARVLGKTLDDSFELTVRDLLCDVVFGVYTAKIKLSENAVPGEGAKGKMTMDVGIRKFFDAHDSGILELKGTYYAIWKDNNKYYLLDLYACDEEGFRVDAADPEEAARYAKAACCVSMNSSVNQLLELLLENTESKDKDPFFIHGVGVLYIKTGSDPANEKVIYREKDTSRRPEPPPSPPTTIVDECDTVVEPHPTPRPQQGGPVDHFAQYPESMSQVELYVNTFDGEKLDEEDREYDAAFGYRVVSPQRLMLRATRNCLDYDFREASRGRQGLIVALVSMTQARLKKEAEWMRADVDGILLDGNAIYEKIVSWILDGSQGELFDDLEEEENYDLPPLDGPDEKFSRGLNHLELSMLPERMRVRANMIRVSWRDSVIEGEANPLANLGEALEKYFDYFDDLLLENRRLVYAVWQLDGKYFACNPYGNDKDGWRDTSEPAAFFVVDSVNELVNLFYGLFEPNDCRFKLHYVSVNLNDADDERTTESVDEALASFEKYKIKFLPITEDDLVEAKPAEEEELEDESLEGEEGEGEHSAHDPLSEELENLFEEVPEPEQSDAPERLNLALVTGIVKIDHSTDNREQEEDLVQHYEKLKYKHPPPFVTPPIRNLCDLLDVKLASKSAHSLLSRFSINSRLAMKDKEEEDSSKQDVTISSSVVVDKSKLISLPRKKYFFSKSLSSGLTPIRAVDEQYIRDKGAEAEQEAECRRERKKKEIEMVPETEAESSAECILPRIIPVGPCIMTPKFKPKTRDCLEKEEKKCTLSEREQEDRVLRKLVCSTENLLLELVLPDFKKCSEVKQDEEECPRTESCPMVSEPDDGEVEAKTSEVRGFGETDDGSVGVILASKCLEGRATCDPSHYKSCYFSAILCVLAKINVDVGEFHGGFLDRLIVATSKIADSTGRLRYKMSRCFRNFHILGARCNVVLRQVRYADPESHEPDGIELILPGFLARHQTGIVVFGNASYAFWTANGRYYLFDPYGCDENGRAAEGGQACLMEICDFVTFLNRLVDNTGEAACRSFRLYTVAITHLEKTKKKKPKKKRRKKKCELPEEDDEPTAMEECKNEDPCKSASETSLNETADWVNKERNDVPAYDGACPGFAPIKNYNASAIEVEVLENDITRPIRAPFKVDENCKPSRQTVFDRKFYENTVLAEPMDLCVMAWAQIYEPPAWSARTMRALFEAAREYALDSLLAAEDTTVQNMPDELLTEFNIANYNFRVVFAPMHPGVLYADEGWNLSMSLEKIFGSTVYTGAVVVCRDVHMGVMKRNDKYYAWWLVNKTKNIRMIVADDMHDYLKLIVKELNEPEEVDFEIRVITISYAKIYGPDCGDIAGLHESMMPSTSLAKIHVKDQRDDFDAVFRSISCPKKPLLVFGSVALQERDAVTEPLAKRCYFVALFAVAMKRDIVQNPLPGMVDKVLELAECVYKLCERPRYHSEHIVKDVCLMGRVFEFRDCASELVCLQGEVEMNDKNFIAIVRRHLRQYLKKSTSGIIHFSNCCYGFWYSKAKCCYYYLDPYQCDEKGKRVCVRGKSCLFMFSTICEMVKRMCLNNFEETTGFFIHQVHVESVDSSACPKFQEDPMWIYLDYHWSYKHVPKSPKPPKKKAKGSQKTKEAKKPMFKNYLIEVPNSIYSAWGTLSAFDTKFGSHAGKNQAAICVAALAMQNLCHPSEWSTVVLDSAVVCGDSYYKDSQKIPTRCRNQFGLTDCLKISPYFWDLEFTADMCGVLYCSTNQPNLADTVEKAFQRSTNLILRCNKKFVAMLKTTEAFYVVDPSWTGPPLFAENRGAIYAIRTRNLNTLIYVVTKMLNTNYRIEFVITPVNMFFKEDACKASESKPKINRKKLLDKPARQSPGATVNHACLVDGCDVVPDEDSYLTYSKHLKFGLAHGAELECAPKSKVIEAMSGKKTCGKRGLSGRRSQTCPASRSGVKSTKSITSILNKTVGYPKILNLIKDIPEECSPEPPKKACITCGPRRDSKKKSPKPDRRRKLEIDIRGSFVYDDEREMFHKYNAEFEKDKYYSYKHGQRDRETCTSAVASVANTIAGASVLAECCSVDGDAEGEEEDETETGAEVTYRTSIHINVGGSNTSNT